MIDNIAVAMCTLRLRYGNTRAIEFGPLALKAVRQVFVDDGKARTYCNRLTDLVRRAFKWGAGEQSSPITTWQSLTAVSGLRQGHKDAPETCLWSRRGLCCRANVAVSADYRGRHGTPATAYRYAPG